MTHGCTHLWEKTSIALMRMCLSTTPWSKWRQQLKLKICPAWRLPGLGHLRAMGQWGANPGQHWGALAGQDREALLEPSAAESSASPGCWSSAPAGTSQPDCSQERSLLLALQRSCRATFHGHEAEQSQMTKDHYGQLMNRLTWVTKADLSKALI